MRRAFIVTCLAALAVAAGCSSSPGRPAYASPRPSLPSCEETNGYPPCVYDGVAPFQDYEDFYPAYDHPYFPGTGVVIVPEPVPVPVPATPPPPPHRTPPPKRHPPHERVCHPTQNHPCP